MFGGLAFLVGDTMAFGVSSGAGLLEMTGRRSGSSPSSVTGGPLRAHPADEGLS
jgi:hypothetical protein